MEPGVKPTQTILPLPPDVISQIKSSTTITSLANVITRLLQNSLDAGSTKINIDVDFGRGNAILEDNGRGIPPSEFRETGGLGKLYHTSKYNLGGGRTYGRDGTFLASLGSVCLLTVTSKHESYFSTNSLVLHQGNVKARYTPAPASHRLEKGTRVVVRDLFGNMPVRVKQRGIVAQDPMEMDKMWEECKSEVVSLLVAYGRPVLVKVRDVGTGRHLNFTPPTEVLAKEASMLSPKHQLAISLLHQAGKVPPGRSGLWIPASASSKTITIRGIISLTPSPTKSTQYLSLGITPLPKSAHHPLYEHINKLFARSQFGVIPEEEISEEEKLRRARDRRFKIEGLTRKQIGVEKGVERWPMFVLGIEVKHGPNFRDRDEGLVHEAVLNKVISVLDALVGRWLEAHHFVRPKQSCKRSASDLDEVSVDSDRPEPRVATPMSRHGTPSSCGLKQESRPRPYTGVATVNSLSRIKSSRGFEFGASATNCGRPGSAPVGKNGSGTISPSNRPLINIEKVSSAYPNERKATKQPRRDDSADVVTKRHTDDAITGQPLAASNDSAMPKDDEIEWTDPVTKQRHRLNARTGMEMPDTRPPIENGSPSRLTSHPGKHIAIPSRCTSSAATEPPPTSWLTNFLETWSNPVFPTRTQPIPRISFNIPQCHDHNHTSKAIDQTFSEVSQMNSSKISKVALKNANVIAQVDEKFILVSLLGEEGENLLVAIDQHAADERVKVEELLQGLCSPPDEDDVVVASQPSGLKSVIKTTSLDKPLKFTISAQEVELFRRHARHFADWGILYNQPDDPHIVIHTLPPLIIERCTSNPKLLITLLRTEIWSRHESPTSSTTSPASHDPDAWIKRVATCPKDLLHMAHSRACRSAIMFNDALSLEECRDLVGRLGECVFPFVCAHGRPSLVPLVELGGAGEEVLGGSTEEMVGLGREEERDCFADAWVEWRARGEDEVEDERM